MSRAGSSITELWTSRIGPALVAPLAVLIIVPLLVGGVGLVVTLTGQAAMERSVRHMAEEQFRDRALAAAATVEEVLRQADPVLDDLQAWIQRAGPEIDPAALARHMNGVIRLSRSVAYLSWSEQDDGDFMGVHLDQDGALVWEQKLHRRDDGGVHRQVFDIDAAGELALRLDEPDHRYDPRTTLWYRQPVAEGGRVWTDPYVWFDLGLPGITCAEPVVTDGETKGVITCDFDLNSLSKLVERVSADEHTRTFLLTRDHVLLGYPGAEMVRQEHGGGQGQNLKLRDIDEPLTRAFAARMPELTAGLSHTFGFTLDAGHRAGWEDGRSEALATIDSLRLGGEEAGGAGGESGGVEWFVVTVGDLEPLLAPAEAHARKALLASGAAVLAALLLSVVFAVHLVRSRRRVVRAERRASAAEAEARELGSYRLTTKLGEGGMGQVWVAEHRMLARPVAVKLIKPAFLSGAKDPAAAVERFNREARTMARMRSRHTIEIYDFGVADDGTLFYVMELLQGLDLKELVDRAGPLPVGRALSILRQAATSLAEAHAAGLVHRDVKPQNIYLCVEPREWDVVKVLDFGMVRAGPAEDSKLTMEGAICGTPAYMAPEQASDPESVDGRADLYALTCVGYWLLAARYVFPAESAIAAVTAHIKEPPPRLDEVAKEPVPPALTDLFARCLAKKREDRPADMAAFIEAIDAILASGAVEPFTTEQAAAWWADVDLARPPAPDEQDEAPTVMARRLAAAR